MISVFLFIFVASGAEAKLQCTVGGHGPYDETRASCLALGQAQAVTNCNLANHSADVQLVAQTSGGQKLHWICSSTYDKPHDQCAIATCKSLDIESKK